MGDFTVWPLGTSATGAAAGAGAVAGASAGAAAATLAADMGAATAWTAAGPPLTMRTLPSASVISSSDTLDSDTRSISVLSLRKSMGRFSCLVRESANLQQNSRTSGISRQPARFIFQFGAGKRRAAGPRGSSGEGGPGLQVGL